MNVTASKNWDLFCFRLTKDVFSEIVGALYVQQYTPHYLETLSNRVRKNEIIVKWWTETERRRCIGWLGCRAVRAREGDSSGTDLGEVLARRGDQDAGVAEAQLVEGQISRVAWFLQ